MSAGAAAGEPATGRGQPAPPGMLTGALTSGLLTGRTMATTSTVPSVTTTSRCATSTGRWSWTRTARSPSPTAARPTACRATTWSRCATSTGPWGCSRTTPSPSAARVRPTARGAATPRRSATSTAPVPRAGRHLRLGAAEQGPQRVRLSSLQECRQQRDQQVEPLGDGHVRGPKQHRQLRRRSARDAGTAGRRSSGRHPGGRAARPHHRPARPRC